MWRLIFSSFLFYPRRVLLDDTDVRGRLGGDGYANYGIDPLAEGVIVVVRPDGYVGAITSFENVHEVEVYFSGFST